MNTLIEYTYTDGTVEVMVHHCPKTHRVLRVYTYANDAHELDGFENEKGRPSAPYTWETGRNPAFVHLKASQVRRFVAEFIDSDELVCSELEAVR